jgi:hypothetical protein
VYAAQPVEPLKVPAEQAVQVEEPAVMKSIIFVPLEYPITA